MDERPDLVVRDGRAGSRDQAVRPPDVLDPLRASIEGRLAALARSAGVEAGDVHCRLEERGSSLQVHVYVPVAVSRSFEQAAAVRVVDTLRAGRTTFGSVDVYVHGAPADLSAS